MAAPYFAGPLFLNAVFSLMLARIVVRSREVPGRFSFFGLMVGSAIWSTGYAMEILSNDMPGMLFWAKFQYLAIAPLPLFWFDFCFKYAALPNWRTIHKVYIVPLTTAAILTMLVAWSNDAHGLLWREVNPPAPGAFPSLALVHGVWFWLHTALAYLLLLAGNIVLLVALIRQRDQLYRWQIALALLAGLMPWLANLHYLLDLGPLAAVDLTPFSFSLAGLIFYIGIFQFRLLAVAPFGHEIIFRGLADPALILDTQKQIIDLNPAALQLFQHTMESAYGRPVYEILPGCPNQMVESGSQVEVKMGEGSRLRYFDLRVDQLHQPTGIAVGWLVVLHDITHQKIEQEELQTRSEYLEAAVAERTEALRQANTQLSHELAIRRDLETRYRGLFDGAPIMYVTTRNQNGSPVITEVNQLFLEALGYERSEVIGHLLEEFYSEDSRTMLLSGGYQEALENKLQMVERQLVTREGTVIWAILRAISDTSETGQVLGTRAMYVDITERKLAEWSLERMANQRQRLLDLSVGMLSTLDLNQALDRILAAIEELLYLDLGMLLWADETAGMLRPHRLIGKESILNRLGDITFPLGQGGIMDLVLRTGKAEMLNHAHLDPRVVHPQNRRAPQEHVLVIPVQFSEQNIGILSIVRITDHPFTQDEFELVQLFGAMAGIAIQNARLYTAIEEQVREIRQKENLLRAVSIQMQNVQETERRNLAAELHDRVGQNLTALTLNVGIMQNMVQTGQIAQVNNRLEDSLVLLQETTQLVRDVMAELRPPALDDFGLLSALRSYGQIIQTRTGLQVNVYHSEVEPELPAEKETALFRIAQEAINNAIKHAHSSQITIWLETLEGEIVLSVQDDGRGFDIHQVSKTSDSAHWGLLTMKERAQAIGGEAEVYSVPNQGTCIRVRIRRENHDSRLAGG